MSPHFLQASGSEVGPPLRPAFFTRALLPGGICSGHRARVWGATVMPRISGARHSHFLGLCLPPTHEPQAGRRQKFPDTERRSLALKQELSEEVMLEPAHSFPPSLLIPPALFCLEPLFPPATSQTYLPNLPPAAPLHSGQWIQVTKAHWQMQIDHKIPGCRSGGHINLSSLQECLGIWQDHLKLCERPHHQPISAPSLPQI